MESSSTGKDRRISRRFNVNWGISALSPDRRDGRKIEGKILNLSSGGFLAYFSKDLVADTNVCLEFVCPESSQRFQFLSKVVWSRSTEAEAKSVLCGLMVTQNLNEGANLETII